MLFGRYVGERFLGRHTDEWLLRKHVGRDFCGRHAREVLLWTHLGRGFWEDIWSNCSESCSWSQADGKTSGVDGRN